MLLIYVFTRFFYIYEKKEVFCCEKYSDAAGFYLPCDITWKMVDVFDEQQANIL